MASLGDSASTVLAAFIGVVLVFAVPFVTLTARYDNVTQENIQLIVDEIVTETTNTGKFTGAMYQNLQNKLAATGNTYDIEIEIYHLDENPGKKTAQANYTKIGENVYYAEYTTQILPQIGIEVGGEKAASNDTILLKKGDRFYISVVNESSTANQTLESSLFSYSNAGEHRISVSSSGMVTVDGTK